MADVSVQSEETRVFVEEEATYVSVTAEEHVAVVEHEGSPAVLTVGLQGPQGPPGSQGPAGPGGQDAHYQLAFTNLAVVVVTHNLGKYPAITVMDSAGTEIEGQVVHDSLNQVTLTFSSSFTGSVTCN